MQSYPGNSEMSLRGHAGEEKKGGCACVVTSRTPKDAVYAPLNTADLRTVPSDVTRVLYRLDHRAGLSPAGLKFTLLL